VSYSDEYATGALRYDVGEHSNPILLPMLSAALEQLLEWTPAAIQSYCARLVASPLAQAGELGFVVEDAAWRAGHLFGLRAPAGVTPQRMQAALAEQRVHASVRGMALRVSPNVYNDERDLEALMAALRLVAHGLAPAAVP
jgi:selenocysteine lyase/cysteine desulfurase